jgi:hypothetical protein
MGNDSECFEVGDMFNQKFCVSMATQAYETTIVQFFQCHLVHSQGIEILGNFVPNQVTVSQINLKGEQNKLR